MGDVPPAEYDLIIRNVRVLDPANDVDAVGDVAVKDGLIVSGVCVHNHADLNQWAATEQYTPAYLHAVQ